MKYEEAIKLKPGTPILIRSKVISVDVTGDIVYGARAHGQEYEVMNARTDCKYVDTLHSEKHKYDPYRKFKKGDIVKCRTVFGRTCNVLESLGVYTVIEDEKEISGNVSIVDSTNITYDVKAVFLELITPVEELGPYYIEETEYEYCVTIMIGERKDSPAVYHKRMHPYAKKAAEAECERLNAEWRKEQNL